MTRPLVLLGVAALGCGPVDRDYSVNVRNDSYSPVTLVLTKDGPPIEEGWVPPEIYAHTLNPPPELSITKVNLPPGKSAEKEGRGAFEKDTRAVLRIYKGQQTIDQMLATGDDSSLRTDLPLSPGRNSVLIDRDGHALLEK